MNIIYIFYNNNIIIYKDMANILPTPYYDNAKLTDESDQEDEKYKNLYNFIATKAEKNRDLQNYLYELGFENQSELKYFQGNPTWFQDIYNLLDENDKKEIKENYLYNIRNILGEGHTNFQFTGGKKKYKKTYRKYKKTYRKNKKTYRKNKKSKNKNTKRLKNTG